MTFTPVIKFCLIVALQVCIILGIVIVKESALTQGRSVLVEIAPVDPRDPFRGDYLVYQLASFTRIEGPMASGEQFYKGQTVFVPMVLATTHEQLGQPIMIPDAARRVTSVEPRDGSLFLRGQVQSFTPATKPSGNYPLLPEMQPKTIPAQLVITYAIEEFFIPEGTGRTFSFANKKALLNISVGQNGAALIKELYIDGKPWSDQ
ncbi:MAG: GDYXXLXY domain-containing protein [Patescibacteria group bacterium]